MIPIKYIRFFVSYIFIVYLFDVIIFCVSLYNFGQTLKWFDSTRFLEWLIIWNGGSTLVKHSTNQVQVQTILLLLLLSTDELYLVNTGNELNKNEKESL